MKKLKKKKRAKRRRWNAVADRVKATSRAGAGVTGAEVGVYDGRMSNALFKLIPGLRLSMVDRWQPYTPAEVAGDPKAKMPRMTRLEWKRIKALAKAVAAAHAGAHIIEADSVDAAPFIADASLDFVFIDGDHSHEGCKRDIAAWWPKVRPGGWLMGHDYGHRPGIKRAVDEFVSFSEIAGMALTIELDSDNVWAVRMEKYSYGQDDD